MAWVSVEKTTDQYQFSVGFKAILNCHPFSCDWLPVTARDVMLWGSGLGELLKNQQQSGIKPLTAVIASKIWQVHLSKRLCELYICSIPIK